MTIELNVTTQYEVETEAAKTVHASIGETILWQGVVELLDARHAAYLAQAKECMKNPGLDGSLGTATWLRLSEESLALKDFVMGAMAETIKEREEYIQTIFEDQRAHGTKTESTQGQSVGGGGFPVSIHSHILNSRNGVSDSRGAKRGVPDVLGEGEESDT